MNNSNNSFMKEALSPIMEFNRHRIGFRDDINTLRALSVSLVLFFHIGQYPGAYHTFESGFIGVDVFFVISGYLVGGGLLIQLQDTGSINLKEFFLKRLRRILPALIGCLSATVIFASLFLDDSRVRETIEGALSAIFVWSNYFWGLRLSSYDAESSAYKMLVHTWSLSIEEQFYLLFPLILLTIKRLKLHKYAGAVKIAGILWLFTFIAGLVLSPILPIDAYFDSVERFWQLLFGALVRVAFASNSKFTQLPAYWNPPRSTAKFLELFSISLILFLAVHPTAVSLLHPGATTLLVVIPTGILLAKPSRLLEAFGKIYLFRLIGLSSYSIYLYHMPVFAGAQLLGLYFHPQNYFLTILLALMLGVLSYVLIESPCLKGVSSSKRFIKLLSVSVVSFLAICFVSWKQELIKSPVLFAVSDQRYGQIEINNRKLQQNSGKFSGSIIGRFPGKNWDEINDLLWYEHKNSKKILLVGNSPSLNFFGAILANIQGRQDIEVARFGVIPVQLDETTIKRIISSPNFREADVVVFNGLFGKSVYPLVLNFIEAALLSGKQTVFAHHVIFKHAKDEITLAKALPGQADYLTLVDRLILNSEKTLTYDQINKLAFDEILPSVRELSSKYKADIENLGAKFTDKYDFMCTKSDEQCYVLDPGTGKKLLYDHHHWTANGQRFFGQKAFESGWIDNLFDS